MSGLLERKTEGTGRFPTYLLDRDQLTPDGAPGLFLGLTIGLRISENY
jgi:hypothetical protein